MGPRRLRGEMRAQNPEGDGAGESHPCRKERGKDGAPGSGKPLRHPKHQGDGMGPGGGKVNIFAVAAVTGRAWCRGYLNG